MPLTPTVAATVMHATHLSVDACPSFSGMPAYLQAAKGGRRKRGVLESLQENTVEATPMAGHKSCMVPFTPAGAATVMRAPRLGEMFYSQTGALMPPTHMCHHDRCSMVVAEALFQWQETNPVWCHSQLLQLLPQMYTPRLAALFHSQTRALMWHHDRYSNVLKNTAYQLHGPSHACSSCQWDAHVLAQRGVFSQTGALMRHMKC